MMMALRETPPKAGNEHASSIQEEKVQGGKRRKNKID